MGMNFLTRVSLNFLVFSKFNEFEKEGKTGNSCDMNNSLTDFKAESMVRFTNYHTCLKKKIYIAI